MKLLALIIAYLISHVISKPQRFRNFEWYKNWMNWFDNTTKFKNRELTVVLSIAIPVLILSGLLNSLVYSQIGALLVSIFVLSYCIGPDSLEEDVDSKQIYKKVGIRKNSKVSVLVKKMTQMSLQRWFGIFFWYLVLGIVGTLIYRLAERYDAYTDENHGGKLSISRLMKILNYPVAWMMVVSLAIASDFERILKKCKPSMTMDNLKNLDDSFLYDAADFAVEICEVEENNEKSIERVTISVLKRMLLVWLVFVSILVIFAN